MSLPARCPVCNAVVTAWPAHGRCPVTRPDLEEWARLRTGLVARLLRDREREDAELDEELLLLHDDLDD